MIFVTVGSMIPFDRLIRAVDGWCRTTDRDDVFAQIGRGTYQPRYMRWIRMMPHADFSKTVREAALLISHAGMGTIITAGQYGKPIVMMPRHQDMGEHNTDHQLATVKWLSQKPGIYVIDSAQELPEAVTRALHSGDRLPERLSSVAPADFIARINNCLDGLGG